MTSKGKWTREITATVMKQTQEYLEVHSTELGLTTGEVIDRLVVNIKAPTPEFAATWVCEQLVLTTSSLAQKDTHEAVYSCLALFALSLFRDGIRPEALWFEVLSRVEILLAQGAEFPE